MVADNEIDPDMILRVAARYVVATFPDEVVREAFDACGGQCECVKSACGHQGKCPTTFTWDERATADEDGWQAHHEVAEAEDGPDTRGNCRILCVRCHKATESYGRQP